MGSPRRGQPTLPFDSTELDNVAGDGINRAFTPDTLSPSLDVSIHVGESEVAGRIRANQSSDMTLVTSKGKFDVHFEPSVDQYDQDDNEHSAAAALLGNNSQERDPEIAAANKPTPNFITTVCTKLFLYVAATITSVPPMINAGLSATHQTADKISWKSWEETPRGNQILAIILMTCTFALNYILAVKFFPKAIEQLKDGKSWREHPIRSGIAFFLGLAGAISLFAVAIQSMSFWPLFAVLMASSAFAINFATRLVSSNNGLKRAYGAIDPDAQLQDAYIKKVRQLKPEHKRTVNASLYAEFQRLNTVDPEALYPQLLLRLDRELSSLARKRPGGLLSANICSEYNIKKIFDTTFDVSLATLVSLVALYIFMRKGENAFAILVSWIAGADSTAFTNLDTLEKTASGLPSGVASAILYWITCLDIRDVITAALMEIFAMKNPKHFIFFTIIMAATVLSGANMLNVGKGVAMDEHGFIAKLNEQAKEILQTVVKYVAGVGGALVNGKTAISAAYPKIPEVNFTADSDILHRVIDIYSSTGFSPYGEAVKNRFSPTFLSRLRQRSTFATNEGLAPPPSFHKAASSNLLVP